MWHLEAHHATALERNTLVLREVDGLLEHGRAVGHKHLKEHLEVRGYAEAANWVYSQALDPGEWTNGGLISLTELRHIHHMAMTPVWGVAPHSQATRIETPGNFREHDIHPFEAGMTPPAWIDVPARIADWIGDVIEVGNRKTTIHTSHTPLPETFAELHNQFEKIHPFLDGNGRTGRLTLNLILVRLGYPPAIIFKNARPAYLAALQKADQGDYGPLGEIIARAMTGLTCTGSLRPTSRAQPDWYRSPPSRTKPSPSMHSDKPPNEGDTRKVIPASAAMARYRSTRPTCPRSDPPTRRAHQTPN